MLNMLDWTPATVWWLVVGGLVAAELVTGTFYLLMMALGAALAALLAHAGVSGVGQMAGAALGGGGAVAAWHAWRRHRAVADQAAPATQHLDVGAVVMVTHWAGDASTRVLHRGAQWNARLARPGPAATGPHRIEAIDGNSLLLQPMATAAIQAEPR